ncbi:L-methionine gamma-lyase [Vanrija pseudolonga]|uniref:L-methionine gamma-lyase n=1 Tax=Vanrija pseudolonga TaxID=143232 RepID=A0AAF1BND0_9TREE|nr:L-methionine gamma-lyase [Vanrija pseudolonga]
MSAWHPDTQAIHGDAQARRTVDPVAPPIYYSSTFRASSADEFASMASDTRHPGFYTRYGNPTHEHVASVVAGLEGTETAMVTASGMGAISTAVLALLKAGDHCIAQTRHYMATAKLFGEMLPRFNVEVTIVEQTDLAAIEAAIKPNTRLIYVETPANPTMVLTDLAGVAGLAAQYSKSTDDDKRIITLADNTFAGPFNSRPAALGIDVVLHSATKSLGGHSDITAGVICTTKSLADHFVWETSLTLGSTLSPMDAWLLLRGIRTLPLRMERINSNALALAEWLETQPEVAKVHYPMLPSHAQHELALKQMTGGGPVVAVEIKGGYEQTSKFVAALKLASQAVSLGGVETLAVHTAAMWAGSMNDAQMLEAGIAPNFVRCSVGLENIEDLKKDFGQALKAE